MLFMLGSLFGIVFSSKSSKASIRYSVICPKDPKLRNMITKGSSSDETRVECTNPISKFMLDGIRGYCFHSITKLMIYSFENGSKLRHLQ